MGVCPCGDAHFTESVYDQKTAQASLRLKTKVWIPKKRQSKILNVNFPSNVHGITIAVQLDSRTPPASGTNILGLAVLNSRSILAIPRPTVRVTSIDASHTGYEVTFFVEQLDSVTAAQNELFDLIFRHVTAAGVQLAAPKNGPYQTHDKRPGRQEKTGDGARSRGIFATMMT